MSDFIKITEQASRYRHLEEMSIGEILANINKEDKSVPGAVELAIPQIKQLVGAITDKMLAGGRLFISGRAPAAALRWWMPANVRPPTAFPTAW